MNYYACAGKSLVVITFVISTLRNRSFCGYRLDYFSYLYWMIIGVVWSKFIRYKFFLLHLNPHHIIFVETFKPWNIYQYDLWFFWSHKKTSVPWSLSSVLVALDENTLQFCYLVMWSVFKNGRYINTFDELDNTREQYLGNNRIYSYINIIAWLSYFRQRNKSFVWFNRPTLNNTT